MRSDDQTAVADYVGWRGGARCGGHELVQDDAPLLLSGTGIVFPHLIQRGPCQFAHADASRA